MNIKNIKDIVIYYEKSGISCLYPTSDELTKHSLRINGDIDSLRSRTLVIDGVINKIESVQTITRPEVYCNGELIASDDLDKLRYKFIADGMKQYNLVYNKDTDLYYEDEVYSAYYLLVNKDFESKYAVTRKFEYDKEYEDITEKYKFFTVVDVDYDKYINTILASNLKSPDFDKGLYYVMFDEIYINTIKQFCDENKLTYEHGKVGYYGEYDKINDKYIKNVVGVIPSSSNQYLTYQDALKAKDKYLKELNRDLSLFISDKLKKETVVDIIYNVNHIKNIINYSDMKKSSDYKLVALKNQLSKLVEGLKLSYDLSEK